MKDLGHRVNRLVVIPQCAVFGLVLVAMALPGHAATQLEQVRYSGDPHELALAHHAPTARVSDGSVKVVVASSRHLRASEGSLVGTLELEVSWWILLGQPVYYYRTRWWSDDLIPLEYEGISRVINRRDLEEHPDLQNQLENLAPYDIELKFDVVFKVDESLEELKEPNCFGPYGEAHGRVTLHGSHLMFARQGVIGDTVSPGSPSKARDFIDWGCIQNQSDEEVRQRVVNTLKQSSTVTFSEMTIWDIEVPRRELRQIYDELYERRDADIAYQETAAMKQDFDDVPLDDALAEMDKAIEGLEYLIAQQEQSAAPKEASAPVVTEIIDINAKNTLLAEQGKYELLHHLKKDLVSENGSPKEGDGRSIVFSRDIIRSSSGYEVSLRAGTQKQIIDTNSTNTVSITGSGDSSGLWFENDSSEFGVPFKVARSFEEFLSIRSPPDESSHDNNVIWVEGLVDFAETDQIEGLQYYLEVNGQQQFFDTDRSGEFKAAVVIGAGENDVSLVGRIEEVDVQRVVRSYMYTGRATELRATLTWDGTADIDLHMYDSNGNHASYAGRRSGSMTLDVDNRNAFGPENISVVEAVSGSYDIRVINFSGTPGITATVHLFRDEVLSETYTHQFSGSQERWDVASVRLD